MSYDFQGVWSFMRKLDDLLPHEGPLDLDDFRKVFAFAVVRMHEVYKAALTPPLDVESKVAVLMAMHAYNQALDDAIQPYATAWEGTEGVVFTLGGLTKLFLHIATSGDLDPIDFDEIVPWLRSHFASTLPHVFNDNPISSRASLVISVRLVAEVHISLVVAAGATETVIVDVWRDNIDAITAHLSKVAWAVDLLEGALLVSPDLDRPPIYLCIHGQVVEERSKALLAPPDSDPPSHRLWHAPPQRFTPGTRRTLPDKKAGVKIVLVD